MGSINTFYKSLSEKEEERRTKGEANFNLMKKGLKNSLDEIDDIFNPIDNWEKLMELNPDEDSDNKEEEENKPLTRAKTTIKPEPKVCCSQICKKCNRSFSCLLICFICGWLFCLIQLIGVQAGIIILNALLSEIVDEIKLLRHETPKDYNFYERIEIASYKSIPEIDVGMFWSFIGLMILKKYDFYWSIILQVFSTIIFILLFFLFDFHTNDKLIEYYSRIELTVLIVSYFLLTISVGSSSMVALKQFFNLYKAFYKKHFDLNIIFCQIGCCKNCTEKVIKNFESKIYVNNKYSKEKEEGKEEPREKNNKKNEMDKFSVKSCEVFIQEKGKEKEENEKDKNIKKKENIKKSNNKEKNEEKEKRLRELQLKEEKEKEKKEEEKEKNKNLEQLFFYFFSTLSALFIILINRAIFTSFEDITSKTVKILLIVIYGASFALSLPFYVFYSIPLINQKIKKIIKIKANTLKFRKDKNPRISRNINNSFQIHININNKLIEQREDSVLKEELLQVKYNQPIIKNMIQRESKSEIIDSKLKINEKKIDNLDSIKVCTCLGYIFFQKKIGERNACIFYDYNSCCSWFCLIMTKPEIIYPSILQLLLQGSSIGFNSLLSDKLLNEYSFKKYMGFFANLIISLLYISIYLIFCRGIKLNKLRNRKKMIYCNIICNDFFFLVYFLFFTSSLSFAYSIKYLKNNFTDQQLEYMLTNTIALFKTMDFQMLSYYDFFDDSDCLNTAVVITFEKIFWMIIEVFFLDYLEIKTKILFIIQVSFASFFFISSFIALIYTFIDIIFLWRK